MAYWALASTATFVVLLAAAVWYMTAMPGKRPQVPFQSIGAGDREALRTLRKHVEVIASEEHNVAHPEALERAARYIEATLARMGYAVERQEFDTAGVAVRNLEVRVGGSRADPTRLLVVGAHYDSASGAVGANDNGSGVAVLLELARALREVRTGGELEIRLVFYVNEEKPWSRTANMGSLVHASALAREGKTVLAMLSLETVGWYSNLEGSQRYPFPFSLLYPSTGDFVGFVGNLRSRPLLRRVIGAFRRQSSIPSEGVAAPESIPGIGWSDHWAYWRFGWPAIMVTDTAPFRYPYYHTLQDTPEKLDYERLLLLTKGLESVLKELALS